MSHKVKKRVRRAARATLITAVTLDLLAIAAPGSAQAQAAGPATTDELDELTEIVVTGFRASLQTALLNKRNANQPIESIAPEDIGKMPDQNVAESLQRVPGVQINRAGGKGTQVLIHGLSQNLITLNGEVFLTGREFYVSGEASGGGAGSNVQYSSLEGIPSEEIGGIDVIKNPTAANGEGGMGGIINLKTRSALAQKEGFNLGGNVQYSDADDTDGGTPNVTLVGGYNFGDNFAITASASYNEQDLLNKEFQDQNRSEWRFTNTAQNGGYAGSPTAGTLSTIGQFYIIPQLAYFTDRQQNNKTKGATLGLEWKWSENWTSSLNYFYVNEEEERTDFSNKAWFNGQGSSATPGTQFPGIDPSQPFEIDDNGVVLSGTFMANGAETATLFQGTEATANNYQFQTTFAGDGKLSGDFGLYYADAKSELQAAQADVEHGRYNYFGTTTVPGGPASPAAPGCNNGGASCTDGNHGYSFNWTNGGDSGLPTVTYPDRFGFTNLLFNPAYTTFKSNWAWANFGEQTKGAVTGNLHFKFNDSLTLTGGLRYTDRDVEQTFGRYLIDGATVGYGGVGAGTAAGNCCMSDIPGQSGSGIYYSDPGYAAIPFSIVGALPAGSPGTSVPALGMLYDSHNSGSLLVKDPSMGGMTHPETYLSTLWTQAGHPNAAQSFFVDTLSSFKVQEKTTTFYLMGDAGDVEGDYHANFGVRVVKTDLEVDGGSPQPRSTWYGTASWNGVNANNVATTNSRSYTDVLPSFNFTLNATENQKVRVGAARVVSPQNLMQLGVGQSYNFTRGEPPGAPPQFKFANGASGNPDLDPFRATQYFLSWEDYVGDNGLFAVGTFYKQVDNFVTTANIPTLVDDDFGGTVGNVTTPVNAGKGKIYGAELAAQYAWEMGFGVAANYTYSQSESDQDTAFDTNLPIPGVSKNSANLTVYFEKLGFNARAAYSWRDKAVNSSLVGSTFSFPDEEGVQKVYGVFSAPYAQLDAQIGYDFKLGDSEAGVFLSANNITNETQHTYLQFENLPFTYNDTGTRMFLGVKFKL